MNEKILSKMHNAFWYCFLLTLTITCGTWLYLLYTKIGLSSMGYELLGTWENIAGTILRHFGITREPSVQMWFTSVPWGKLVYSIFYSLLTFGSFYVIFKFGQIFGYFFLVLFAITFGKSVLHAMVIYGMCVYLPMYLIFTYFGYHFSVAIKKKDMINDHKVKDSTLSMTVAFWSVYLLLFVMSVYTGFIIFFC
eukprot:TRINITY_DN18126_c0_g1_i1.p1 TRINITY_DN18126_c0_g1~~TRINITY_DN18126_c0_g1_i1.p1  ORF type:complete len:202 (-),score=3.34 TRINITY_DN18126_c0_g1_i1:72-653(-)